MVLPPRLRKGGSRLAITSLTTITEEDEEQRSRRKRRRRRGEEKEEESREEVRALNGDGRAGSRKTKPRSAVIQEAVPALI